MKKTGGYSTIRLFLLNFAPQKTIEIIRNKSSCSSKNLKLGT